MKCSAQSVNDSRQLEQSQRMAYRRVTARHAYVTSNHEYWLGTCKTAQMYMVNGGENCKHS